MLWCKEVGVVPYCNRKKHLDLVLAHQHGSKTAKQKLDQLCKSKTVYTRTIGTSAFSLKLALSRNIGSAAALRQSKMRKDIMLLLFSKMQVKMIISEIMWPDIRNLLFPTWSQKIERPESMICIKGAMWAANLIIAFAMSHELPSMPDVPIPRTYWD